MSPLESVRVWRLFDTEPQTPAWHAACDTSLFEARMGGLSPNAIVFHVFSAPCLRLGAHQLASDVALETCRTKGIDLHRRVTGGPAVLADERQVAFSLFVARKEGDSDLVDRVNGAVAHALQKLGCPAEARAGGPEFQSRKLGWIHSAADGDAFLIQGHLYVRLEPEELAALAPTKTPVVSLFETGAGAAPPVGDIRQTLLEVFAERFGVSIETGELTNEERALLAAKIPEARREGRLDAVRAPEGLTSEASISGHGGTIRASLLHGEERNKIRRVVFSGDFCAHPRSLPADLAAALNDSDINQSPTLVEEFFDRTQGEVPGLSPGDFFAALSLAFMKRRVALSSAPDPSAWKKTVS